MSALLADRLGRSMLATVVAVGLGIAPAAAAWTPDRSVNVIVTSSAGGGSDLFSRTITGIMTKQKIVPVPFLVENRTGGSGAVGFSYAAKKVGDPYTLANVSVSFFTTPLLGESPVSYKDFTPVVGIADDAYVMLVSAKSPLKTIEDIKAKGSIVSGTTGIVADPSLLAQKLKGALGIKVNVVPYGGDGEVTSALLGGHIDVQFGNPSEVLPLIKSGELRPIAMSSSTRLAALPDVPTFKEIGVDIVLVQLRGFVLPKDVPADAVAYWVDAFKKATSTPEWKAEYIDRFNVVPIFLSGAELAAEMEKRNADYEQLMRGLDLIKKK